MKLISAVLFLSTSVMVVMIYQAVRQELSLRGMKASMLYNSAEVKRKEAGIVQMKGQIQQMNTALIPLRSSKDALSKRKEQSAKAAVDLEASQAVCVTEKGEAEKKKTALAESLVQVKAEHEAAKTKAQEEIQSLKQQILDRDKAICAFVDTTNAEGRKMCGLTETPK